MTLKKCIHNTTLNNEALPCSKSDKVGLKEVAKLMINAPTGKFSFNEAMTQEDKWHKKIVKDLATFFKYPMGTYEQC